VTERIEPRPCRHPGPAANTKVRSRGSPVFRNRSSRPSTRRPVRRFPRIPTYTQYRRSERSPWLPQSSYLVSHQTGRSFFGLIPVFDVGPPVESDDGFVFFESRRLLCKRDVSFGQGMQYLLHRSDCVHEWRDAIDDDAKAEIFKFGRPSSGVRPPSSMFANLRHVERPADVSISSRLVGASMKSASAPARAYRFAAAERFVQPVDLARVRSRDDESVGVDAILRRCADIRLHLFRAHQSLSGNMPAALGRHLVFRRNTAWAPSLS